MAGLPKCSDAMTNPRLTAGDACFLGTNRARMFTRDRVNLGKRQWVNSRKRRSSLKTSRNPAVHPRILSVCFRANTSSYHWKSGSALAARAKSVTLQWLPGLRMSRLTGRLSMAGKSTHSNTIQIRTGGNQFFGLIEPATSRCRTTQPSPCRTRERAVCVSTRRSASAGGSEGSHERYIHYDVAELSGPGANSRNFPFIRQAERSRRPAAPVAGIQCQIVGSVRERRCDSGSMSQPEKAIHAACGGNAAELDEGDSCGGEMCN